MTIGYDENNSLPESLAGFYNFFLFRACSPETVGLVFRFAASLARSIFSLPIEAKSGSWCADVFW